MGTTAWIASPAETVELLDELGVMMAFRQKRGNLSASEGTTLEVL